MLAADVAPRSRRRRRLPSMLAMTAIVGVFAATGMLIAARKTIDSVGRVPNVSTHLSPGGSSIENFLLVGSDSRAGADPTAADAGGIGTEADVSGHRSDTIMILRRDKSTGDASLLSIPRDLWVQVPGHDGKRRINSAFNDGPEVLVQTLQQELGLPIHHYVEIDFSGFKSLVDALGGVQICVNYATRDVSTGLNITEPGCHILDGVQALAYARSRHYEEFREDEQWHEDPASDIGRTKRQQQFVNLALQSALDRIKVDPFSAGRLATTIGSALRVDDELDPIAAASSLRSAVDAGIATYSLPVFGKTIGGNAVLLLGDGSDAVLAYFRGEGPAPAPNA
ncbi:MAG: LCP family protein [Ilumatobacteraceae bacterium]|nr:LCP family protein [Ilumatobacteraceae bacterium]